LDPPSTKEFLQDGVGGGMRNDGRLCLLGQIGALDWELGGEGAPVFLAAPAWSRVARLELRVGDREWVVIHRISLF
jgi:hypothetical protein